jgi:potassium-transporting ATPase KdpC subunit
MKKIFSQSFVMLLIMTLLTGVLYPFFITLIGQIIFPSEANGSLVYKNGKTIGSYLIGQNFSSDRYFQSRPSAIDYNPLPSGASNLAVSSKLLKYQVDLRRIEFLKKNNLADTVKVPSEMLFASGSGVDPHISKEAAYLQVNRIVKTRKLNKTQSQFIYQLIDSLTESPQFGIFGYDVVNVLALNEKLDKILK